jgi:hypothetical protein
MIRGRLFSTEHSNHILEVDFDAEVLMGKDIYDFIVAVLEQLHGWISGGLLALGVELLDRVLDWKIPRKPWIAIFIVAGLFVSVFAAWREERNKVRAQTSYMSINPGASWIKPAALWTPNKQEFINFGKENATSYPATEECSIQELVIRQAPHPLTGLFTPDTNPSSPDLEKSAWEEMLRDRQDARHSCGTYDPGEKEYSSAYTKGVVSEQQLDRIEFQKIDMSRHARCYGFSTILPNIWLFSMYS